MNSFSPRKYHENDCKALLPSQLFLKTSGPLPTIKEKDQWYMREEANDWRPVMDTVIW
jgi:hypothetical protein